MIYTTQTEPIVWCWWYFYTMVTMFSFNVCSTFCTI